MGREARGCLGVMEAAGPWGLPLLPLVPRAWVLVGQGTLWGTRPPGVRLLGGSATGLWGTSSDKMGTGTPAEG